MESTTVTTERISTRAASLERYLRVRGVTEAICEPLSPEDHLPQPIEDVSPPKWHLGHTAWFFEEMLLSRYARNYERFDPQFAWIFNSYYESLGPRIERPRRGVLSRPPLSKVLAFRKHVDERMAELVDTCSDAVWEELSGLVELGLHHEQQHQELLLTDIKYILSCNPGHPAYTKRNEPPAIASSESSFVDLEGGLFELGHMGEGFSYDNESPRHTTYVAPFRLQNRLVTNGEFLEFVEDGGYGDVRHWLSDAWTEVQEKEWTSPLYWQRLDGEWYEYTLYGVEKLDPSAPVCHISYYEAEAFAQWKGLRIPSEAEWEFASRLAVRETAQGFYDAGEFHPSAVDPRSLEAQPNSLHQFFGSCWEWTASAYLPYPGYRRVAGPFGEYNGKFMINQMVLRGGSIATSLDHIRPTYRNFFQPGKRWQFKGLRLAEQF
ncbi:MAG: ergothioneine biosynthesis protein EgtB [Planctomycetota bacterium]